MEELQLLIPEEIFKKLVEKDVATTVAFLIEDTYNLSKITGQTSDEIEEIKLNVAKLIHKPNKIIKAIDLAPWSRLSTGCASIDSILRKGVPTGHITEIFGCSGVGKTQFCLQLALQVQLPVSLGGLQKGAVFICTEDVFPSKRLHQLANSFKTKHNLPEKDFDGSVFIKQVSDIDELQKCLTVELPLLLRKKNIGLVVVDSIAGPFRGENENYMTRSRDLIDIAHKLNDIGEENNLVILCTNQVSEDIENNKTEPSLGLTWSNSINYRCQISRYHDTSRREFEIIFSPDCVSNKCSFFISQEGLESDITC